MSEAPQKGGVASLFTQEALLTKPDRDIPADNPQFSAVRELTHKIGDSIIRGRFFSGDFRALGIKNWSVSVATERRFSIDNVERRINELANPLYYDIPLWAHLPFQREDIDPVVRRVRLQSCYLPNEKNPLWNDLKRQIGIAMRGGNLTL